VLSRTDEPQTMIDLTAAPSPQVRERSGRWVQAAANRNPRSRADQ
jgi:hypothetical protein